MRYTLNIDWLSVYCIAHTWAKKQYIVTNDITEVDGFTYQRQQYGTRQFKVLTFVYEGKEKFAEIQSQPFSGILEEGACIVKFDNALLYRPFLGDRVMAFLEVHNLQPKSISRLDVAADFLRFESYDVVPFIRDFMAMELRHIGRGNGASYFEHRAKKDKVTGHSIYSMQYSGLSFGSHSSDVRIYLYNKTKELAEVSDKPYIRDSWTAAEFGNYSGLWLSQYMRNEMQPVWRLEVSLKGKGLKFKDATTMQIVEVNVPDVFDPDFLRTLYFTMIHDYFQFVKNRKGITNITREPRIDLFGTDAPIINRRALRSVSGGNMSERITIHKLWQMSEEYRKMDNEEDRYRTQQLAHDLAKATDLLQWLRDKRPTWGTKQYKR